MFERFTNRARRVVVLAQEEARLLQHNYIGTEHILLGIIHEGEGSAVAALRAMDVDLAVLSEEVKALVGRGEQSPSGHIPFTPRAKKTLELSLREALQLSCDYIGTEHILLGLIREGDGVAGQVLTARGITLERAREEVGRLLESARGERPARADRAGHAGVSPEEISLQLRVIGQRLAAIELKLGIEPSPAQRQLRKIDLALARLRRQKESAIDEQDFERAAKLRENEKTLLQSRGEAEQALAAEEDAGAPPGAEPPGSAESA